MFKPRGLRPYIFFENCNKDCIKCGYDHTDPKRSKRSKDGGMANLPTRPVSKKQAADKKLVDANSQYISPFSQLYINIINQISRS